MPQGRSLARIREGVKAPEIEPRIRGLIVLAALAAVATPAFAAAHAGPTWSSLDLVCLNTTVGSVEATIPASNAIRRDTPIGGGRPGGEMGAASAYFGLDAPFSALAFDIGRPGTGNGHVEWEYSSSSGWKSLIVTDETHSFSERGRHEVTFTPPVDWVSRSMRADPLPPCAGSFFFVREYTTAMYDRAPLASQVWANG